MVIQRVHSSITGSRRYKTSFCLSRSRFCHDPRADLDEVLAFIYIGPTKPTPEDFKRTPLLVRRNMVATALNWLKLNHRDYFDLEISQENLDQYPENGIPVVVGYRCSESNEILEATSVHGQDGLEGTTEGACPFVVHGLTEDELLRMKTKDLKSAALQHLMNGKFVLGIGQASTPESLYNNPQLYPKMFPWLYPYGLGGLNNAFLQNSLSDKAYKHHMLMYHDKRFQLDPEFVLIAFNHEQIKASTNGGYLTAKMSQFDSIANRLLRVDTGVLTGLAERMETGEQIKPEPMDSKVPSSGRRGRHPRET